MVYTEKGESICFQLSPLPELKKVLCTDMNSVLPNLPLDIIEQILLKLPTRSVLLLKTVCRQWRTLICDPIFAREHVKLGGNLHHRFVGISTVLLGSKPSSKITSQSIDYQQLNLVHTVFHFQPPLHPSSIFGSCRGLLLLGNLEFGNPFLWNPLFKDKYNYLPPCKMTSSSSFARFVGLGYASSIDDYNVVSVRSKIISYNGKRTEVFAGEIYSLKTHSWRTIKNCIPFTNTTFGSSVAAGCHVQGSIYWAVQNGYEFILALDLATEKCKLIGTPPHYRKKFYMVEIGGCLAAYQSESDYEIWKVVIWTWNKEQWSILVRIPTEGSMYIRCLISMDNRLVLQVHEEISQKIFSKFVIWDLQSWTTRNIPSARFSSLVLAETLVSPIGGDDKTQL